MLSFILTAQLHLSSCAVKIHDETFCSPVPGYGGAVCDNFLTSNQVILDQLQWEELQASWIGAGQSVECTSSQTVADIKGELEKLCSKTPCTYAMKIAIKGLKKILSLGDKSHSLSLQ